MSRPQRHVAVSQMLCGGPVSPDGPRSGGRSSESWICPSMAHLHRKLRTYVTIPKGLSEGPGCCCGPGFGSTSPHVSNCAPRPSLRGPGLSSIASAGRRKRTLLLGGCPSTKYVTLGCLAKVPMGVVGLSAFTCTDGQSNTPGGSAGGLGPWFPYSGV